MIRLIKTSAIAVALLTLVALPVSAQTSKDTIRIAVNDPFNALETYTALGEEPNFYIHGLYQQLIGYHETKKIWVPILAKSFRRIDDTTIEFDLRDNVKFHSGNLLTSADVKETVDYVLDPKTKSIFGPRFFSWLKEVEVLGPYKVRFHGNQRFALDLSMIAYRLPILDSKFLASLSDKTDYGRMSDNGAGAVGTGAYRLISLDRNKGAVFESFKDYFGADGYFRAPVKRVEAIFLPDKKTRMAQLLTGGIDIIRGITPDEAEALSGKPDLAVTTTPSGNLLFVTFDALGRSQNKVMTDERVRKAFVMALDRKLLVKQIVPGGESAYIAMAICLPSVVGCAPTTDVYPYDPAYAKRLLAEAGYPNGVDLVIDVRQELAGIAEAIAGEVRKVGFRASVQSLVSNVYTKKRAGGELTTLVAAYTIGTQPDMSSMLGYFFEGAVDYWGDPLISKARADGDSELDVTKRTQLYTPVLDRINTKAYILPISEFPLQWAHHKDVRIFENPLASSFLTLGDFGWK